MTKRVLHLTLYKKWFNEILEKKKTVEFRKITPYWTRRLEGKTYEYVHFVNGYGTHRPWVDVSLIKIEKDDVYYDEYGLHLGEILRSGNL